MTLQERCEAQARSMDEEGWYVAANVLRLAADALPTDGGDMNVAELTGSLALLGMSQTDAARFFKVNDRTVRRWIAGEQPIPEAVAIALWLMIKHGETADSVVHSRKS